MSEQKGIVAAGSIVSITVAATDATLYTLDTGRSVQRGTITAAGGAPFIIRRLWLYSGQAAAVTITIGELVALAFTQRLPTIDLLPAVLQVMGEGTLMPFPSWRFTSSAIIRSSAAAVAPNNIQAFAEVVSLPSGTV
jgi:hypothetical protein